MVLILNNIMKRAGSLYIFTVVAVMVCSLYAEGADVRPLETKSDAASIRSLESPEVRLANASLELRCGDSVLTKEVTVENDPPLVGEESDRSPRRSESYMKDFVPLDFGVMGLKKGKQPLVLSALEIPGKQSVEMRLIMLNRISDI